MKTLAALFLGVACLGAKADVLYTEYTRIPVKADNKTCYRNAVVLPQVLWRDIGKVYVKYRVDAYPSDHLMLFSTTETADGAARKNPYISLKPNGSGGLNYNAAVSMTATVTPGDNYAAGPDVHEITFTINASTAAYFVFGGAWTESGWSGTADWYALTITDKSGATMVDLRPVVKDGVAGFEDAATKEFFTCAQPESWIPFVAGPEHAPEMTVEGVPYELGTPVPDYGRATDVGSGFSCPVAATNEADTIRGECIGWLLTKCDGTQLSGVGTTAPIAYDNSFCYSHLTWQWRTSYAVNVRTVCNGRIVGEEKLWTNDAGEITLTRPAIPDGCEFAGWYGPGVYDDIRTDDLVNLTFTAPGTVYAVFRASGATDVVRFVDYENGTDDDGSEAPGPETAWQTLGYAVGRAKAGDMVVLTKGTHVFPAAVTVDKAITITGDGENWETTIDEISLAGDKKKGIILKVTGDGALVQNLTFKNFGYIYQAILAISMTGDSVVSNVVVTGTTPDGTAGNGYTPVNVEKGLLTHCWITNNVAFGNSGVWLKGTAVMENCYIAGNRQPVCDYYSERGIVRISSANAAMRNCTVVDNAFAKNDYVNGAVHVTEDADIRNNLIWGNVNLFTGLGADVYNSVAAPKKWVGNCSLPRVGTEENGNTGDDPMLQSDRRHFLSASPCRGAAVPPAPATDLDGNPRGDKPSIGAFEYVPPATLQVSFVPSASLVRLPAKITFDVSIEGPGADDVTYNWDFDGDGNVDSHEVSPILDEIGVYNPTLEVVAGDMHATAAASEKLCVHAEGKMTFFVDPTNGSDENDGLSDATPWKNLAAALRQTMPTDGDEFVIAKGTHTLTEKPVIDKAVTVRGAGENWETVLDGNFQNYAFNIKSAGACLHSLTLQHMGSNSTMPYALDMTAEGVVSNVVFRGTNEGKTISGGRCIVTATAGLLTHCWVTNNISGANVGFYLSDTACVRDSYFANNTRVDGQWNYGVLQLYGSNVKAENCTIVDNIVRLSKALYCTSGAKAYNCLVWNNVDDGTAALANVYVGDPQYNAKYMIGNCTSPTNDLRGAGNIQDDPQLSADRMHFKSTSPCRGAAVAEYATATDLDGNPRGASPSIGAFEYVDTGSLEVSLGRFAAFARLPDGIVLSATVNGNYAEPLVYSWDFDGDGEEDSDEASPTLATAGIFRPRLKVKDANELSAEAVFEENLIVHEEGSSIYYVSDETGDDANTGLDPAAPMKTYMYALASDLVVDGDVIELMKGVHRPERIATISKRVVFRGAGKPEETLIDGQNVNTRIEIKTAGVLLCNLTMYRTGNNYAAPLAVNVDAESVVSNVVMCGCNQGYKATDSGNSRYVAMASNGGLLTHCVITNNNAWGCAGASVTGASRMENCLVADNCNFLKDVSYGGNGIVEVQGSYDGPVPSLVNCTIVSNRTCGTAALRISETGFTRPFKPVIANNVVWDNIDHTTGNCMNWQCLSSKKTSDEMTSNMVANCTSPIAGISGAKNIDQDPLFSAKAPYHPSLASPCRGAGDNTSVTATTDLDGNPRRYGRKVDMGCYELQGGAGLMLLVR